MKNSLFTKNKTLLTLLVIFSLFNNKISAAPHQKQEFVQQKAKITESISSLEERCHKEINRVRQKYGLSSLKWWPKLAECARKHSQQMAAGKCQFGHDGFENRFKQMQKICSIYFFGENVAYSYHYADPVKIAVTEWMKSEGHKKNILENFQESGIGVAISPEGKCYITQLFATRV